MSSIDSNASRVRGMLARSKVITQRFRSARVWLEIPTVAVGRSDYEEVNREGRKLEELARCLGKELVGTPDFFLSDDDLEGLYSDVGHALIEGYHGKLFRDLKDELELWRRGDWRGLHERGWLSEEFYREYSEEFPDGNPWHKGSDPEEETDTWS